MSIVIFNSRVEQRVLIERELKGAAEKALDKERHLINQREIEMAKKV